MTGVSRILPLVCLAAAVCLIAAEFTTMFEFRVGGRVFDTQDGGDRHGYALVVAAVFAIGALAMHLATGARSAAVAVAAAGAIALAVFLVIDLPDANQIGELDQPVLVPSKAEPASGFWLQLAGAAALTLAGAALAAGGGAGSSRDGARRPQDARAARTESDRNPASRVEEF